MRTTDPDPQPFRPLGEKVAPKPSAPAQPQQVAPGIERMPDGRLRTNIPANEVKR